MQIRLSKRQIIEIACYCREAERSVDKVLFAHWSMLQEYYSPVKRAAIGRVIERLELLLPTCGERSYPSPIIGEFGWAQRLLEVRMLWNRIAGKWKKTWVFSDTVVYFIAAALRKLLALLDRPDKPDNSELIAMRKNFYDCQWLIDRRCYGLPELAKASRIDHFLISYHLVPVRMEELLGSDAADRQTVAVR
jgi:hypothetical protein